MRLIVKNATLYGAKDGSIIFESLPYFYHVKVNVYSISLKLIMFRLTIKIIPLEISYSQDWEQIITLTKSGIRSLDPSRTAL